MPLLQPKFRLPLKFIFGTLLIVAVTARPGTNDNYGQQFKSGARKDADSSSASHEDRHTFRTQGRASTPAYGKGFDYGSGSGGSHKIGSGAVPNFGDSVLTKSAEITGTLMCGDVPVKDAVVRLYRNVSETVENLLAVVNSTADGSFRIEGNTAGKGAAEAGIVPRIRIFHKCDDGEKEKGYRTFGFTVADELYVSLGRIARKAFNIGKLNVQVIYPGEKRELKFTNDQPLGAPI